MAVTLKDVAALVGVSVNTASRALKDKEDIGFKTRERVKEAAAALCYRPNLNARSLVLRKTSTVGVAVTEADNPVRMEFCERLRDFADADGYRLLNISLSMDWGKDMVALEDLLSRRVDGLIVGYIHGLTGEQPLGRILRECRQGDTPAVVFGNPETELADCVEIDFFDSAYQLTAHAIKCGYEDVVMFCSFPDSTRAQGYMRAMADCGLPDKALIWPVSGIGFAHAAASLEAYLEKFGKVPRAIIGFNDISAIGIMSALKKHGFLIPEDCAVAGFDNIAYGEYYDPPLTSIGFDNGDFARIVWQLLKSRLDKTEAGPAKRLKLHQELVIRQSC